MPPIRGLRIRQTGKPSFLHGNDIKVWHSESRAAHNALVKIFVGRQ